LFSIFRGLDALDSYNGTECEKIKQYTAVVGPAAILPTFGLVCKYCILILSIIQIVKEVS
jgi:hypothetical protein